MREPTLRGERHSICRAASPLDAVWYGALLAAVSSPRMNSLGLQVTRNAPAGRRLAQCRSLHRATFERMRTAGTERTTFQPFHRFAEAAADRQRAAILLHARHRHGGDERARVGMQR